MKVAMIFYTEKPVPVARSYNPLENGQKSFAKELLFLLVRHSETIIEINGDFHLSFS